MKRFFVVMVLVVAIALIGAGAAMATVLNSKHDMRTFMTSLNGGYNEVCVYCHTPHGQFADPLWNRTSITTVFTPYASTTSTVMDGTLGAQSLACMSCHDGVQAVDALYNAPNYGTLPADNGADAVLNASKVITPGRSSVIGANLSDDHPVGFDYATAIAVNPANSLVALATVQADPDVRLFGQMVECASCHDPHNTTAGQEPFLRASNANSAICLSCHIK